MPRYGPPACPPYTRWSRAGLRPANAITPCMFPLSESTTAGPGSDIVRKAAAAEPSGENHVYPSRGDIVHRLLGNWPSARRRTMALKRCPLHSHPHSIECLNWCAAELTYNVRSRETCTGRSRLPGEDQLGSNDCREEKPRVHISASNRRIAIIQTAFC